MARAHCSTVLPHGAHAVRAAVRRFDRCAWAGVGEISACSPIPTATG